MQLKFLKSSWYSRLRLIRRLQSNLGHWPDGVPGRSCFDCVGKPAGWSWFRGAAAGAAANLGQVGDHLVALGGVGEQGREGGGDVRGGEAVLQQFGDDAAAGDQVDHGDGQVAGGVGRSGQNSAG